MSARAIARAILYDSDDDRIIHLDVMPGLVFL